MAAKYCWLLEGRRQYGKAILGKVVDAWDWISRALQYFFTQGADHFSCIAVAKTYMKSCAKIPRQAGYGWEQRLRQHGLQIS